MEHLLFHLVIEAIQAIDRKMQRPLHKAVPELAELRANPAEFLRRTPVTFGPRKRRVLATVIGFLIGSVVVALLLWAFTKMPKAKEVDPWRVVGVIVSFVVVGFVSRSVALRLLHGGSVTLRLQGAEFTQDDTSLFLPWDLLHTAGALFEADHKSVVLPINPTIPVALGNEEGRVQAVMPNELDTPFAQFGDGQVALKDLYDVRLSELGALLFDLGLRLGVPRNAMEQAWAEVPPLAVPDDKGWLRIHLTQLPFPPLCAGCSEYTPETMNINIAVQNRTMSLALPFCRTCAAAKKRSRLIAFSIGAVIGLVAGILVPVAVLPFAQRRPMLAVILGLATAVCVGVTAILIAALVVRDRSMPVRWKEYQPDKATVKLRFRRPDKSAGLMEALGIPVEHSRPARQR